MIRNGSCGRFFNVVDLVNRLEAEHRIDLISEEALKTSAIEGEYLDRESLQSSLRQQLCLGDEVKRVSLAERGIAEMMADVYLQFAKPLSHRTLYAWHKMVMSGERRIETIGSYRKHADAMQIISNQLDRPKVHFEAPPSARVKSRDGCFRCLVQQHIAQRQVSASRPHAGRYRPPLFREHPSI